MILELHLCGPKGEGSLLLLQKAMELAQLDNEMVIEAMLRAGQSVPDTVDELGIPYHPPSWHEAQDDRQAIRGLRQMLEAGYWSCGDAAPYEAAVQRKKYGRNARTIARAVSGDGLAHGVYEMPGAGIIDPVERYHRARGTRPHWEATAARPPSRRPNDMRGANRPRGGRVR